MSLNLKLLLHVFTYVHTCSKKEVPFGNTVLFMLVLYHLQSSATVALSCYSYIIRMYSVLRKPIFVLLFISIVRQCLLSLSSIYGSVSPALHEEPSYILIPIVKNLCCAKVSHQQRTKGYLLCV